MTEKFPFALIHVNGCGKIAFYLRRKPESGELLSSKDVVALDGGGFMPGTRITCLDCGKALTQSDLTSSAVIRQN